MNGNKGWMSLFIEKMARDEDLLQCDKVIVHRDEDMLLVDDSLRVHDLVEDCRSTRRAGIHALLWIPRFKGRARLITSRGNEDIKF